MTMVGPSRFEGSASADAALLAPNARLECGICWHVYDPAEGDPVWQVPPGLPFAALPDHWRCPRCDAPKHKFLPLDAVAADARIDAVAQEDRVPALLAAYRSAELRMRGLPVHNAALAVEALPFVPWDDGQLGIVVTPWFMNLTLIPSDPTGWAELLPGETIERALPSGVYEFLVGDLDGFGRVLSCSLFSPMAEFPDRSVAMITAQSALEEVLRRPMPDGSRALAMRAPVSDAANALSGQSLSGQASTGRTLSEAAPGPRPVGRRSLFSLSAGRGAGPGGGG